MGKPAKFFVLADNGEDTGATTERNAIAAGMRMIDEADSVGVYRLIATVSKAPSPAVVTYESK